MKSISYAGTELIVSDDYARYFLGYTVVLKRTRLTSWLAMPGYLNGSLVPATIEVNVNPECPMVISPYDGELAEPPGSFEAAAELQKWVQEDSASLEAQQ